MKKKTIQSYALLLKDPDEGYVLERIKLEGEWLYPISYSKDDILDIQKLMRKEQIRVPTKIVECIIKL